MGVPGVPYGSKPGGNPVSGVIVGGELQPSEGSSNDTINYATGDGPFDRSPISVLNPKDVYEVRVGSSTAPPEIKHGWEIMDGRRNQDLFVRGRAGGTR